ncbi:MAG: 50S ribosomal protein L30 [Candidatus Electryonea clarkiae]|nr:50S ribosomal protein L30 [Candidatus Electryonea clarkiae]MDP8288609.1 50S ribosomal protein L30 [Candidatus Electryonea clarkiae]
MSEGKIKITYIKSQIHRSYRQKRIIAALGLKKLNHSVIHSDSPNIRGMIYKVSHMVRTEPVEG